MPQINDDPVIRGSLGLAFMLAGGGAIIPFFMKAAAQPSPEQALGAMAIPAFIGSKLFLAGFSCLHSGRLISDSLLKSWWKPAALAVAVTGLSAGATESRIQYEALKVEEEKHLWPPSMFPVLKEPPPQAVPVPVARPAPVPAPPPEAVADQQPEPPATPAPVPVRIEAPAPDQAPPAEPPAEGPETEEEAAAPPPVPAPAFIPELPY